MTDLPDAEKIEFARASLGFYIGWAHKTDMPETQGGHAVPQPHHLRIIERMEKVAESVLRQGGWRSLGGERHTSVVAPPGSGKTVLLQGFYEWLVGKASLEWGGNWADMIHLGHISHSADQAWRMSYAVRETIENNAAFQVTFPKVKPSGKWAEREWRVEGCIGKDSTFIAMGVEGSLPGVRLNFLGLDDLIKPEAVKLSNITPAEVEAVIYTVHAVGMKRLVEGGCAWMNHTRWFERDPPAWAEEQGWTTLLIPALIEDETVSTDVELRTVEGGSEPSIAAENAGSFRSFWPERQIFSLENLLRERERDPEGFALQFMGQPAPAEGIDFKREWLEYEFDQLPWNDAEDRLNFAFVGSWDTAGTLNARSDYSAGWMAAIDMRGWNIYLLNLFHGKLEFPEVVDAIRGSVLSEFRPQRVWVEEKATGQSAIQQLQREGIQVNGVPAYGQRGSPKLQAVINQTKLVLSSGRVHWPSERFAVAHGLGWIGEAKRALIAYPRTLHDDIARAFIQLVYESFSLEQEMGVYDPRAEELTWGTPSGEKVRV